MIVRISLFKASHRQIRASGGEESLCGSKRGRFWIRCQVLRYSKSKFIKFLLRANSDLRESNKSSFVQDSTITHCNALKPRRFAAFPSFHPFFYFAPFCLQKDDIRIHKRGRTGTKKRYGSISFTILRYT